jgi:hypothetical protein
MKQQLKKRLLKKLKSGKGKGLRKLKESDR